ncbi:hypothetical protein HNQ80_001026 [Anaerosolibacter carboniphilus]|uniref:Uncharacterized protein n=1 Tax=Anaerosolibacter carboniphilus TaxID=1417629 RepID=A0A841KNT6_9FIRM|nr:hypothetical protein [Anaerosolibacter carboniphilus]MBB6214941.1 hypothetical protein [Anaerosolibacter carboniphilus]
MKGKFIITMTVAAMLAMNSAAYGADQDVVGKLWKETQIEYAEKKIDEYMSSGWDLLGWRGEKIYFQLRDDYSRGSIIKQIEFEMQTAGKQFRMIEKNYKDNDLIYDAFLLTCLGGKTISKYFKVGKVTRAKNKAQVVKNFKKSKGEIIKKVISGLK